MNIQQVKNSLALLRNSIMLSLFSLAFFTFGSTIFLKKGNKNHTYISKLNQIYRESSPFLNASTGESIDAFLAGIAAAITDSITGNDNAIKMVNQFIIKPTFN